jgi:hypothetical protein
VFPNFLCFCKLAFIQSCQDVTGVLHQDPNSRDPIRDPNTLNKEMSGGEEQRKEVGSLWEETRVSAQPIFLEHKHGLWV